MSQDDELPTNSPESDSHSETFRDGALAVPLNLTPPNVADHELIRIVGSGAYGDVWLARNVMGAYRAVKVVYRARFNSDRPYEREYSGIERFEPISRSHESQVNILHIGRTKDCFFYVMELADPVEPVESPPTDSVQPVTTEIVDSTGSSSRRTRIVPVDPDAYQPRTLRSEFKTRGRLSFGDCMEISLALTKALDHLHANGLVHRDIKPANIIFVGGRPKLADIGLVAETDATMSYVGTEGYIPPEGPGKPPADIYSLGKTIYEISTGRDRNDFPELPTLLMEESERSGLVELNEVVLRACEENVADRYSSALEMHEDLVQIQAGKSVKQMHYLERQLKLLRRVAAVGTAILALFGLFWYQARESEKRIATEVSKMSQQRAEDLLRDGRLIEAMPWLTQSIKQSAHDKSTVSRLENIFASALAQSPTPIWDIPEGASGATFSKDGDHLFVKRDDRVHVYDVNSHSELRQLIHSNRVGWCVYSPTTNWLASTERQSTNIVIWDWKTGERLFELEGHRAQSYKRKFFSDGKRLISRTRNEGQRPDNDEVILWNLETRKVERTWDLNARDGNMDLHPSGSVFAVTLSNTNSANTKSLRVYDVDSGSLLIDRKYSGNPGTVQFSPDGNWLAFGKNIRLLETTNWTEVTIPSKIRTPWIARFSPDSSRLLLVNDLGDQQVVQLDQLGSLNYSPMVRQDPATWNQMGSVGFSQDSRFLSLADGSRNTAHLLDAQSLHPVVSVLPTEFISWHMTFHPLRPWVLVRENNNGKIRIWDYGDAANSLDQVFPPNTNPVVRWHAGTDRLLLGEWMGNVTIRSRTAAGTGPLISTNLSNHSIWAGSFSDSGNLAIIAGKNVTNRTWAQWLWKEGDPFRPLTPPATGVLKGVTFSPDESLCALSTSNGFYVYDIQTRTLRNSFPNLNTWDVSGIPLAFGADNSWLASVESNALVIWDLNSGAERIRIPTEWSILNLLRTIDDKILVRQSGVVSLYSPLSGKVLAVKRFASRDNDFIKVSHDGQRIARVGPDSLVHILRTTDLTPAQPAIRLSRPADIVEWSIDGSRLITANELYARVWSAETGKPLSAPLLHGTTISRHPWQGPLSQPSFIGFTEDDSRGVMFGSDGAIRDWPTEFPNISNERMKQISDLYSGQRIEDASITVPIPAHELASMREVSPN